MMSLMKNAQHKLTRLFSLLLILVMMCTVNAVETITYYHNDALGSPVAATDESGNLLWREAYLPYGERLQKQDNNTNDTWFTGKQEDKATGLSYFGARWYDPVLGRFTGIDPVGFQENNIHSFNRYAYANNNPYKYVDPDGRSSALAACYAGPAACVVGVGITTIAFYQAIKGTQDALSGKYLSGAKDNPTTTTDGESDEWIYGPKDDPKINEDGSTKPNTWTTPDDYGSQDEAQDKLDPFKPLNGRRPARIPKGTGVKKGNTPGGEGPFNGSGGGKETLIPNGLPSGSAGNWKPLK